MARRRRSRFERAGQGAFPLADLHERPPPRIAWLRLVLTAVLGLSVLAAATAGLIRLLIDTDDLHEQAQAALVHVTGRDVRIGRHLAITSYFGATVAIDDIIIPALPGADPADMVRIDRIEAELSHTSLLFGRPQINRLVISGPDIALSIDANGRGNWQPLAPPTPPAPPTPLAPPSRLTMPRNVHIKDGKLTFADARSGRTTTLALRRLTLSEVEAGGLLAVAADLAYGPQRFSATGQIGPLARLTDRTATSSWPVRLALDTQGAKLSITGGLTRPLDLAGYTVKLDAWLADSSTLAGVIPYRLPAMRTVSLTARIADTGGSFPDIAGARLQMGASDLTAWVPGLKLDTVDIAMPGMEQSARGEFLGTLNGVPLRLLASLGGLSAFLPERADVDERFPIDVALEMGDTRLSLKGAIAAVGARRGLDLALTGQVRDLELLTPLAGRPLPRLRNVEFAVRLGDGARTGFADSVALRGLSVTAPQGDLAGDLVLSYAPRWALAGSLTSTRIDADALALVLAPAIGIIDIVEPLSPFRRPAWDDTRTLPNARLRLDVLRQADADLTVAFDDVRVVEIPYRKLAGRIRLAQGRLDLGPLLADLPSGQATLRLEVDASDANAPRGTPMHLRTSIPGLPVQPLLASSSRRDNLFGTLEVEADLTAEGDTPRALAATVSGRLGLAIVEGDIDSRLLLDPLANVMGAARVPLNLVTQIGSLARLRCFAARLDAERGQAKIGAMILESGRVLLEAEGGFDLAAEELALRLRSSIRIPGQAITVPSRLEGSFANPRMALDPPDPARAAAIARPDAPDACIAALELARSGRAGPMPAGRDTRPNLVAPPSRPRR